MYPLRGLKGQKQIWSWISFDVANQSFTLLINTLLFSIFFSEVVVRNSEMDDRIWALTYGTSMLLTALLSPLAGAAADSRACKKAGLLFTGIGCGLLTCGLALIQPGQVWLAVLLYIPANLLFAIGENFLASFLPFLGKPQQIGRISGFSWAVAYFSALVLLVLTAFLMSIWRLHDPEQWRPFFVVAGLWFLVFIVPTAIWLKEPPLDPSQGSDENLIVAGFRRLHESLQQVGQYRDLGMLMLASLFFATAMSVVVFFASKLAAEYGFKQVELVLFVAVITVSGIFGTVLPTLYQDRLGHRRTTVALLWVWLLTALGFAGYAYLHQQHQLGGGGEAFPTWPLWLVGNLLGFGLGALGTANRAFVGYLAPPERSAEVFGIWGLTLKISAIMTFPFAWVRDTTGTPAALLVLAGFLIVGLLLTQQVDERRGHLAAHQEALEQP